MAYTLDNYVEVADRIRAWYDEHPQGRIETDVVEFSDVRVVVKAWVYRDGELAPAGIGHSFLEIPGATPYTRGSELENAETSAVGRALVMAGIPAKNVASANEVRGKQDVQPVPTAGPNTPGGKLGEGSSSGCSHATTSTEKVDGNPLPGGRHRCLVCGKVSGPGGVFK
jgi:hypothetical protein